MADELLPCAHCGYAVDLLMQNPDDPHTLYWARCKNDDCLVETLLGTKEEIIVSWNSRHEPDTLPSWAIEAIGEIKSELQMGIINHPHSYRETIRCCELVIEAILALRKPEEKCPH